MDLVADALRPRREPVACAWRRGGAARALGVVGAWALAVLLAGGQPRLAGAGTEEFSTFDVEQQEEDDESVLDHVLTRAPRAWTPEWDRAAIAFRTEQGCLTSGQWFMHTDLKLRTALGDRARFGLTLHEIQDDVVRFQYLDLAFQFPTRIGTVGGMFRPFFDKSRQDLAVTWETGADTSAVQIQAAFTFEDAFNNLWAFRQTRVGDRSEPYLQHPYEPALRLATRHDHWRAEIAGKYLSPSRKQIPGLFPEDPVRLETLWGARGNASFAASAGPWEWEVDGENHQAFGTSAIEGAPFGDNGNFRRSWAVESAVRHALRPDLVAELRARYQDRDQHHEAPAGPGSFGGIDRVYGAELEWGFRPGWTGRVGGLYDRISIAQSGAIFRQSYGTRTESRAYIGLAARFGRVVVSGVEGIELDPESYEVWFVHDKGFLQLQAVF